LEIFLVHLSLRGFFRFDKPSSVTNLPALAHWNTISSKTFLNPCLVLFPQSAPPSLSTNLPIRPISLDQGPTDHQNFPYEARLPFSRRLRRSPGKRYGGPCPPLCTALRVRFVKWLVSFTSPPLNAQMVFNKVTSPPVFPVVIETPPPPPQNLLFDSPTKNDRVPRRPLLFPMARLVNPPLLTSILPLSFASV